MRGSLSDEQYKELLKEEHAFSSLINHGFCKNLSFPYLQSMRGIFQDVFDSPLNVNCAACISDAMHRLWQLMEGKRIEAKRKEEDLIIQDTINKRDLTLKTKK